MSSLDKLTIDTPEQTSLEFPLAGIGSRFLAVAADTAIQLVGAFMLVVLAAILIPVMGLAGVRTTQWMIAAVILGLFLLNFGYFAFFETVWNGQTPGKRYAHLRVMKDDGRPISAYDAIARNLLRIVDQLPALYGIGIASVFFSEQNKRLGDYVAGTVVVHEKTLEGVRPVGETRPDDTLPSFDTSRITADELRLIETFIQRRDSFDPALRSSMAAQIADRLGAKLEVRVYGWPRTEKFLEAILQQCRSTGRLIS